MSTIRKVSLIGGITILSLIIGGIGAKHLMLIDINSGIEDHNQRFNKANPHLIMDYTTSSTLLGNESFDIYLKDKLTNQTLMTFSGSINPHVISQDATISGKLIPNGALTQYISSSKPEIADINGKINRSGSSLRFKFNEITVMGGEEKTKDNKVVRNQVKIQPFTGQTDFDVNKEQTTSTFNNIKVMGLKNPTNPVDIYPIINNLNYTVEMINSDATKKIKVVAKADGVNINTKVGNLTTGLSEGLFDIQKTNNDWTSNLYLNIATIKTNLFKGLEYNTSSLLLNTTTTGKSNPYGQNTSTLSAIKDGFSFKLNSLQYKSMLGDASLSGFFVTDPSSEGQAFNLKSNTNIEINGQFDHKFLVSYQPYLRTFTDGGADFNFNNVKFDYTNGVVSSEPDLPRLTKIIEDTMSMLTQEPSSSTNITTQK